MHQCIGVVYKIKFDELHSLEIKMYDSMMNVTNKILAFLSGYNEEVLNYCPKNETYQVYSLGAVNLLSSLLSFVTFYFAFKIIGITVVLSTLLALCLGLINIFINRLFSQNDRLNFRSIPTTIIFLVYLLLSTLLVYYPLLIQIFYLDLGYIEGGGIIGMIEDINKHLSSSPAVRFIALIIFITLTTINFVPFFVQIKISKNMNVYQELITLNERQFIKNAKDRIKIYGNIGQELNIIDIIKRNIYNNDLRNAINYLNLVIDVNMLFEERIELITLVYRISRLRNEFAHNTIDNDFANRELNSLKSDLLILLDRLAGVKNLNLPQLDKNHIYIAS